MSQPATSSGVLAVSAAASITARPARCLSVTLLPGSATSSVIIYDNAAGAASGTVLCKLIAAANGPAVQWEVTDGVVANAGLSYALAGTAAEVLVHYCAE